MSRTDRAYSDEPNETDRHSSGDRDDDTGFPHAWSPFGRGWGWGWPSDYWWPDGEETSDSVPTGEDDGWVDEGFFALIIAVGLLLFVVPEPGTSIVGILLALAGAIAWLFDTVTETGS